MVAVSKNRRVFSFDVFDTCLARLCGDPRCSIEVLSLRLQAMMGDACSEHFRQYFVATRLNCGGHSLKEIYTQLSEEFPVPFSVEEMVRLEMEVERDLLVPIAATRQLVDQLRQKGDILFISDMYLPDDFIRDQLIRHGFFREGDRLYVSDTVMAWKADGSLYRLVHEREGISYRRWHHYGDNRQSDFKVPRRLGIHAHHLKYDYLFYEEQCLQQPVVGYPYPTILAGLSRAVRLQSEAPESQSRFVADITAPFMMAWVYGVLKEARKRGIRRLYFLARDVHSEYHIAKRIAHLFPEIELRYLFISSRSLYDSPQVALFLQDQGLFDPIPSAVVDSCSSGKTLRELNAILAKHHCNQFYGFFMVNLSTQESGPDDVGDYYFNDIYLMKVAPKRVNRILGMRILFELLLSLNYHCTVVDYEFHGEKIRPVFKKDDHDKWCFDNRSSRQAKKDNDSMLIAYSNAFALLGLHNHSDMILERLAVPSMLDFVDRPRKEYLEYLHHFIWWGKPFVRRVRGSKKGVWKRGNRAFVLPSWMMNLYYSLISNQVVRKKINRFVSWMPILKKVRK